MLAMSSSIGFVWVRWAVGAILAAIVASGASAQPERVIRDDTRHFSMTLLEGWTRLNQGDLDRMNQIWSSTQGESNGASKYLFGLTPDEQPPEGKVLVLVEWEPSQNASLSASQVESVIRTNVEAVRRDLGATTGAELSVPVFDWERKRAAFMTSLPSPTGAVEAISYGMLAVDGVLWVHCYTPAAHIGRLGPTFARIANSITIDAAYVYAPAPEPSSEPSGGNRSAASTRMMTTLLVGGVIIALALAIVFRGKKSDDRADR